MLYMIDKRLFKVVSIRVPGADIAAVQFENLEAEVAVIIRFFFLDFWAFLGVFF